VQLIEQVGRRRRLARDESEQHEQQTRNASDTGAQSIPESDAKKRAVGHS